MLTQVLEDNGTDIRVGNVNVFGIAPLDRRNVVSDEFVEENDWEQLVFTEPVADIGRNSVDDANASDAADLARDAEIVAAMGEAKWRFMTAAEALIHGDLHTGSVMVRGSGCSPGGGAKPGCSRRRRWRGASSGSPR